MRSRISIRPAGNRVVTGAWPSARLLELFGMVLAPGPSPSQVDLEFSVRLHGGQIDRFGRFGFWTDGAPDAAARIDAILLRLAAPAEVRLALPLGVVRRGVAVSLSTGPEFRLHLHGRDAYGADSYTAFRWRPGGTARRCSYSFHYAPEGPAGERPEMLAHPAFRDAASALAGDPRFRHMSGFWLRTDTDGALDQVDFAFPWQPPAASLPGLAPLLAGAEDLVDLPVRDIAFTTAGAAPSMTLHCSAPARSVWPATEEELQEQVRAPRRRGRSHPLMADFEDGTADTPAAQRLDAFPSGSIDHWRAILGPDLHHHHGLFDASDAISDDPDAMARAMRRAVTSLYRFIPAGATVYDVGCGWGGPLGMLARDRGCAVLGLTISRNQFRHIAGLGLPVRWGDAERTLPPRRFDCALLLESLESVRDKARLLRVLRQFAGRLVMRVNCQDHAPAGAAFGTMERVGSDALRGLIEGAGWRVQHWRNRRNETMQTHEDWYRRLQALPAGIVAGDPHLREFQAWCARVLTDRTVWAAANPLIEVVAS
jgi:hypothetical protein